MYTGPAIITQIQYQFNGGNAPAGTTDGWNWGVSPVRGANQFAIARALVPIPSGIILLDSTTVGGDVTNDPRLIPLNEVNPGPLYVNTLVPWDVFCIWFLADTVGATLLNISWAVMFGPAPIQR
jgi:hypothetical protein